MKKKQTNKQRKKDQEADFWSITYLGILLLGAIVIAPLFVSSFDLFILVPVCCCCCCWFGDDLVAWAVLLFNLWLLLLLLLFIIDEETDDSDFIGRFIKWLLDLSSIILLFPKFTFLLFAPVWLLFEWEVPFLI